MTVFIVWLALELLIKRTTKPALPHLRACLRPKQRLLALTFVVTLLIHLLGVAHFYLVMGFFLVELVLRVSITPTEIDSSNNKEECGDDAIYFS